MGKSDVKLLSLFAVTLVGISLSQCYGGTMVDSSQAAEADTQTYAVRSNACEAIRITLLSCMPSSGLDRDPLCKKAQSRLLPTAFDDLRSSVADNSASIDLIESFRQKTTMRMDQILAMPQTDDAHAEAKPIVTASRSDCFQLLDELE